MYLLKLDTVVSCGDTSWVQEGCLYGENFMQLITVARWLQWLACPLPTGRRWLRLGSDPGGSVGGVPDHA